MRASYKKLFGSMLALLCVALLWRFAFAAADYDIRTTVPPFQVITVTTGATINVLIPEDDLTIAHLNIQNDGSTASVSTDYVVVMMNKDSAGVAVTMAANLNDGAKVPVFAGGSTTIRGQAVPVGADSGREIQIKAVGHGAKLCLIRGRSPRE